MFSISPKTKEVKLVVECYKIIKALQPLKNDNINNFYELFETAVNELKNNSILKNDIVKIDIEKYLCDEIKTFNNEITELDKEQFLKEIDDTFTEYKKENYDLDVVVYKTIEHFINT